MQTPTHSADVHSQQKSMTEAWIASSGLEFLSLSEVASLLRVSRITVYRIVAKKLISVYRIGRRMRFRKTDVLSYIESNHYGGKEV